MLADLFRDRTVEGAVGWDRILQERLGRESGTAAKAVRAAFLTPLLRPPMSIR